MMKPYPEYLESGRTVLLRARPEHAGSLHAFCVDPEVMRYMDWLAPAGVGSVRTHLESMSDAWQSGTELQWIIQDKRSGVVAGTIAVRPTIEAADFGYFLGRAFWGRGLAFDAASAVLDLLESERDIPRVWATVDAENLRSRRLLERLGLQLERVDRGATFRPNIGGPPRDTAFYARTRKDG